MRKIVNDYYEDSGEQDLVRKAVSEAWVKERRLNSESDGLSTGTLQTKLQTFRYYNNRMETAIHFNHSFSITITIVTFCVWLGKD